AVHRFMLLRSAALAVIGHQADADHGSVAITIVTARYRGFGQAEGQIRIDPVIFRVEADALEIVFGKGIAVRPIVRQRQGCLNEEPAERMTYRARSNTYKEQLASAQFCNNGPSQYVVVEAEAYAEISEHSRSCHDEHVRALQPDDRLKASIQLQR